MKVSNIVSETTTAGSVATVATPLFTQSRKGGNLLTGKKTKKKYANSLSEGKMKELSMDLSGGKDGLSDVEFKKKYGKTKAEMRAVLSQKQEKVSEAKLEEDDLIIVPGQGKRLKPGFIPREQDRTDHEVEMALSDLYNAASNAQKLYSLLENVSEEQGIEGWVQEKIIKANDYLNTVREYYEHKMMTREGLGAGVIGSGFAGESVAEGAINEFSPDGFRGGEGDEFDPNLAEAAHEEGVRAGMTLVDPKTLAEALDIYRWNKIAGGMYKEYFAEGFKEGRLDKIRHGNKQYNLNLKLMKDGSIKHGKQGVTEGADEHIVQCSQCGEKFKRNEPYGFSHCDSHRNMEALDLDEDHDVEGGPMTKAMDTLSDILKAAQDKHEIRVTIGKKEGRIPVNHAINISNLFKQASAEGRAEDFIHIFTSLESFVKMLKNPKYLDALKKVVVQKGPSPEGLRGTAMYDYIAKATDPDAKPQSSMKMIGEKAVSKAQQRFMGMVHAAQKGEKPASKEVAKVAKTMGKKAAKDFAQTKHKGLPGKKKD